MDVYNPIDGMPANAPVVKVRCECGATVTLWWNGGECDRDICPCGKVYWTEATGIILRIE